MRLHLLSLIGHTVGTTVVADPCVAVHESSVCENGFCSGLFWITPDRTMYTYDVLDILRGLTGVNCAEAEQMLLSGQDEPIFKPFDTHLFTESLHRKTDLAMAISLSLDRFPWDPVQDPASTTNGFIAELLSDVTFDLEPTEIEERFTREKLLLTSEYQVLFWKLYQIHATVSIASLRNRMIFRKLAPYINMIVGIESAAPIAGSMFDGVHDMIAMYAVPITGEVVVTASDNIYYPVFPVSEEEPQRGIMYMTAMDYIGREAARIRFAIQAGGDPIDSVTDTHIDEFVSLIRMLNDLAEEDSGPEVEPSLLLLHLFRKNICNFFAPVVEYLLFVSVKYPARSSRLNHVVATMSQLCLRDTSVADRVSASIMFKGPRPIDPFKLRRQVMIINRPENVDQQAVDFLLEPRSPVWLDLIMVVEGAEHVGYMGPRKQWISNVIQRLFTLDENWEGNIWEYTDDRKQYITLKRDMTTLLAKYCRAAGRAFGLAIRYDIPLGVPLAGSMIKTLRGLYEPETDMAVIDSLLATEDPVFLASFGEFDEIDWDDPPPQISWMDFSGLTTNGDLDTVNQGNWQEYVRLNKMKKLFWSNTAAVIEFRAGVMDTIGVGALGMLTEEELRSRILPVEGGFSAELLWNGITFRNLDPSNARHAELQGWLRTMIFEMTDEERGLFNLFTTGVRNPPLTARTGPWIKLFFEPTLATTLLPMTHTCHNEFKLPMYTSLNDFRQKVMTAIRETGSIEGYEGYNAVPAVAAQAAEGTNT